MNKLTETLQHIIPPDTIFPVVSDHGMVSSEDGVTGTHSDHAFWSLNINTHWKPKEITDFFHKIIGWLKINN